MELNVAGLVQDSITDGPGIRFTIFCQGCPHHCAGCHNPETWEFCEKTRMDTQLIFSKIQKNPLLGGVTFSGGEPFTQAAAFAELGRYCKQAGYEVASYSGYTFEELLQKAQGEQAVMDLLQILDVLVDGPFLEKQKSLELLFRGSRNQRILDVPASLQAGKPVEKDDGRWSRPKDWFPPVTIHYEL